MSALSERIAIGLRNGFPNPKDPERQPPIVLPAFRTVGMDPELTKSISEATDLLAQAILASIETDYELVPRADLAALRQASEAPAAVVSVHCRCDPALKDPLLELRVRGSVATVDPRALAALQQRPTECPH